METVALLYEDYQKELAEDFKNTFLKRASDTDSSRSNDTVIDEVTDMLSTNIAVYTEKLLQRWGFSSGGEGGGGGDVTVTLDDLLKKYLSDNYVTIKGDQEVFGEKDFRKGIRIAGRRLYWDEGNDALVIEGAAYTTRWLSAKGVSPGGGGAGSGGAAAMYQLIDVSPNDTKDAVLGAEKDYVLTFDGSFWRGMPNKGGLSSKLFTALDKEGNEVNPDDENAEIYAIRANYALWSVDWISAKGKSSGGSGGGGGLINLVYGFESLGGTFDNNDNSATFNAFTINEIWKLASSGLTNVTVTGSGNAVTDVIKGSDGRSLTFTKGSTFATKSEFDALNTKFNDFLTGSDADDIINKWSELEVFLQGMKESDNLAVILQSKMDKTAFSKLFTALDASGNEVDPSDDTKTIASIRANFGFWGVDYISAKGVSKGSGGTGGASTLYQLVDVLANDTEDGVEGAAAGKALVFDGTHWRAGDAGLNESQLYSYLTANKYLTQSAADSRYVTSSRKVIAGTGLSGGGALTSDVTLSLATTGVKAGTYTKVTVDTYGRVTVGDNPTTLAGYGITDAYTKTEADGKYVTIATPQTITGQKTFTKNIAMNSGIGLSYSGNTVFRNTSGNTVISSYGDSGMLYFRPNGDTSDVGVVQINKQGHINGVSAGFKGGVSAARLSATEYVQIGDAYLKWDAANNAVYVIKKDGTTPVGFYSTDWLSAKGVSMSGAQTGTLDSLNDVEITDPVNGQALKYDAASKKWVNGTIDSFNVNQMWAELKKADSSKVIDASHIPTSVLDGRWVKKAGDTMTGTLTSASSSGSIVFKGVENCDITNIYKDNGVIRNDDGGLTSIRNGLRFNWYDTYWYIGNLRGGSTESAGFGVVDHNNKLVLRVTPNDVRAPRFMSTVATGLSPLIVSSNTTVDNLNADLLDNWHIMDIPRNYNSTATYSLQFALGGTDNNWKKIFACSESGAGPYRSVTVWGSIWYAYGNHAQDEVRSYHFCAIFQMRSGPSASDSNVGDISNSARLYLPTFAKGMDNIRLVRVGTNNFELQVRQIDSYNNGYIQYQYWANGANVSAWRGLQSTSNTSVAVSAGGASTLADSRASSADVWTTARTFYIQDYHSANTGAGVSVNGGSDCYLKLPSTTRFSRIDFSTPDANIRHSGNDNGNEVGSSTLSNLVIDSWYGVSFTTTCSSTYQNKIAMSVNCRTGRVTANNFHAATNITANGAITAKASSSDIRLKTDIQGYDAMGIIRKFRSVKYHWNAIAKENSEVFNHDNWNYGLIAQDLLSGGYSQWVKDAFNDYYTIDYERLIPVVWKGLQEVDDEVTKLKREVARLNKRVKELEKSLCA